MHVFPKQRRLVVRPAHTLAVAKANDAEHAELIRDVEQVADILLGLSVVRRVTVTHLTPAAA